MKLVIRDRREESDGVVSLLLEHPEGDSLPQWQPGAHLDLILGNGLVRQYSLASDPADRRRYRVGVLREPQSRGGSEFVHTALNVGDLVEVSAPRNNFALHVSPKYVFIAGGIGVTPILPMVAAADAAGADWRLVYGGRTRASMAFLPELAVYGDKVQLVPQDELGHPDLPGLLGQPIPETLVYVCGPDPLLTAVERNMTAWPDGSLHLERFAPKEQEFEPDHEFEVEFVDSGLTATVPVGVSILSVAEGAGLNVFSSCQEGTCGTCETTIVAGRAEHRDSLLTPAERDAQTTMMICVSRAERGCAKLSLQL